MLEDPYSRLYYWNSYYLVWSLASSEVTKTVKPDGVAGVVEVSSGEEVVDQEAVDRVVRGLR